MAATIGTAGLIWAQADAPPPPPQGAPDTPPPSSAPPEPLFSIPNELTDPAFARFVGLSLLGQAFLKNDPPLYSWTGMKDIFSLSFANEPAKANGIVAAGGGNITLAKIVAAGGGNLTFASIVAAGGGNMILPDSAVPQNIREAAGQRQGGYNLANIVAAGGGNLTINDLINKVPSVRQSQIQLPNSIVAAGGGNYVQKLSTLTMLIGNDGASIRNADALKLISKGGAGLNTYGLQSVGSSPAFKNAKRY